MILTLIKYHLTEQANYFLFGEKKTGYNTHYYQNAFYVKEVSGELYDIHKVDVQDGAYVEVVKDESLIKQFKEKTRQLSLQLYFTPGQDDKKDEHLAVEFEEVDSFPELVNNLIGEATEVLIREAQDVGDVILAITELENDLITREVPSIIRETIKKRLMDSWTTANNERNKTSIIPI